MQLIFGNDRLDRRQLPDLMPQRLRIGAGETLTAVSTGLRPTRDDVLALVAGNEFTFVLGVTGLAAT